MAQYQPPRHTPQYRINHVGNNTFVGHQSHYCHPGQIPTAYAELNFYLELKRLLPHCTLDEFKQFIESSNLLTHDDNFFRSTFSHTICLYAAESIRLDILLYIQSQPYFKGIHEDHFFDNIVTDQHLDIIQWALILPPPYGVRIEFFKLWSLAIENQSYGVLNWIKLHYQDHTEKQRAELYCSPILKSPTYGALCRLEYEFAPKYIPQECKELMKCYNDCFQELEYDILGKDIFSLIKQYM